METLFTLIAYIVYVGMAALALWGSFCVVLVWRRVGEIRFSSEEEQEEFLDELDAELTDGDYAAASELCEDDRRAMPQLAIYAIENRDLGVPRVKRQLAERFQQDVLADIEHRLSWVSTVTKSAPMVGLFGTVLGMMGAFNTLATAEQVDPSAMAGNIGVALVTTACGLAIAVPLVIATASINIQIGKMEDLIAAGMSRLMDMLETAMGGADVRTTRSRARAAEPAVAEVVED
ncbi:MAG: MotA/TolQ/ExbB proton channel family protein [Planctomycetota bacterium]